MKETVQLKANVTVKLIRNGKVIQEETGHNVTCNAGLVAVAAMVAGQKTAVFNYLAVGTGAVTPAPTLTALVSEISRVIASMTIFSIIVTNDTAQAVGGFTFTAPYTITEAGIFDAVTSGDMLGYVSNFGSPEFGPFNVLAGDQMTLTWNVIVGAYE